MMAIGVALLLAAKRLPPYIYIVQATIGGTAVGVYETASLMQAREIELAIGAARGINPQPGFDRHALASEQERAARESKNVGWRQILVACTALPVVVWMLLRLPTTSNESVDAVGDEASASALEPPKTRNLGPGPRVDNPWSYQQCKALKTRAIQEIEGKQFDRDAQQANRYWLDSYRECKRQAGLVEDEIKRRTGVAVFLEFEGGITIVKQKPKPSEMARVKAAIAEFNSATGRKNFYQEAESSQLPDIPVEENPVFHEDCDFWKGTPDGKKCDDKVVAMEKHIQKRTGLRVSLSDGQLNVLAPPTPTPDQLAKLESAVAELGGKADLTGAR